MSNEQLVAEYAVTRSPVSLDQIVRDNQRLLHHVLKRFATADEPYEDLLQVANLGLIKAVQRFDPDKGVRFSTYAVPVVEGEVRHHLRDSLLLRQPRWVKKIYHEIEDAVGVLTKRLGRPPHLSEIAAELNITTLAEGVETVDQLKMLRERGIQELQGFLFSRPVPLDAANRLIKNIALRSRGPTPAPGQPSMTPYSEHLGRRATDATDG